MKCNSLESRLQLHCAVSGPSVSPFSLHWYVGGVAGEEDAVRVEELSDYTTVVGQVITAVRADGARRIVNSTLHTLPISHAHQGRCFWCEVETTEVTPEGTLHRPSQRHCVDHATEMSILPACEDEVVVVSTEPSCAVLQDAMLYNARVVREAGSAMDSQQQMLSEDNLNASIPPTSSPPSLPTATGIATSLPVVLVTISATHTDSTSAIRPSQTILMSPSATSASTPSPTLSPGSDALNIDIKPTATPALFPSSSPTNETTPQPSSVEGGLLAAVAVCVVFIIAIIFLITIVIHLSRQKCRCCRAEKEVDLRRMESECAVLVGSLNMITTITGVVCC